ncbi:MAG: integration host factor subunit beta [Syntrophobacterales bacterium]|nr:integration host factor subunit beta [Syntrophobacterales bacterium]
MTKSQLITMLAKTEGISVRVAEIIVDTTFKVLEEAMIKGDRIEIRGFGSFKVKSYDGYKGRNPRTGALIEVEPKRLPFFKVGKDLQRLVNGGDKPME